MEVILMLVSLMFNRLGLNSSNSSKPPSTDPNRKRKSRGKGLKRTNGVRSMIVVLARYNPDGVAL